MMPYELPDLPYLEDALEPYYSAQTIGFHYGKHHKTYVDNLNKLVGGTDLDGMSLEELVRKTVGVPQSTAVFNNAAQVWNHTFFWNCMKPNGGGAPESEVARRLSEAFGGMESFHSQFKAAAMARFGSGWAWLVDDDGALSIMTTLNAETPIMSGKKPLLTIDVWEHAYYLDYQNRRAEYVQQFLDNLVNWDFVAANMSE
jgi:superoxide dismutase, Fe-Mn family